MTLPRRWSEHPLTALVACLLAGWLAYLPALHGELLWDDTYLVGENPFFKSPVFGLEVFRHWLFFDSFSTYYRPVQNWSYMLDYWLWRGSPVGYHATNILLHSLSGFLLWCLLRRIVPGLLDAERRHVAPWLAWIVALLWTVHPIHNAAVAYISGRADSLAGFFALSAWLVSFRAGQARGRPARVLLTLAAAACGLLALCSKEIALLWAALFALHLLFFARSAGWRRTLGPVAVAVAVVGIYAGLHSLPESRAPMEDGPPPPLAARTLLMLRALGDYTGLILFPSKLHMERALSDPGALRSAQAWRENLRGDHLSALGLLAALGAAALCRSRLPGQRLRRFGALWFAVAFLPISNLFPLNAEVAEHWIYLASIGFLVFLAASVLALPPRWQRAAVGFAAIALVALGARTAIRAGDWVDAETFCQRTIASGAASPRVVLTLADVYARRGEFDRQERLLRKMRERYPEYAPGRIQLGLCLQRQGRSAEAAPLLQIDATQAGDEARRHPRTWSAAWQIARTHLDAGETGAALALLRGARGLFPEPWPLAALEARTQLAAGDRSAALAVAGEYARAHWWHLDARLLHGELLAEAGATTDALAVLRQTARLDLYDPRPLSMIARIELARGQAEAAIEAQTEAIRRQPHQRDGHLTLAAILDHLGRRPEAAASVQRAESISAPL